MSQPLTLTGGSGASTNARARGRERWGSDAYAERDFTNTGTVTIGTGRTWTVTGGTLNQAAGTLGGSGDAVAELDDGEFHDVVHERGDALTLSSATFNGPGVLTNAAGRTLVAQSSTIAAALVNEGLLRLRATNTISGPLATSTTSTLRVEGDGTCCAAATTVTGTFNNNGLIELTAINAGTSAALTVLGNLENSIPGTIESAVGAGGARTVTATLNNLGTLTVSQPLTVTGSLAHADGAVLRGARP